MVPKSDRPQAEWIIQLPMKLPVMWLAPMVSCSQHA